MWTKKDGKCNCYFCQRGREHRHLSDVEWEPMGHLQVAESLDPNDIIKTRVCKICAHEERTEQS
jgi:hypothetical protein